MEKYLREIQSGRREGSTVSVQTVDSLSKQDRAAWRAIRKDLESVGITAEAYEANQNFIRDWLIRALDTGALDQQAVPAGEKDESFQQPPHLVPNSNRTHSPNPEGEAFTAIDSKSPDILEANGIDATIGPEASVPVGHPSVVSTSGRAYHPVRDGEAVPKVPVSGHKTRKAGDISKLTVKNQPVSRVAALVAMISRPKARLLHLVNSTDPEDRPQIALLLQNPAKRRLIDADTIHEAFFTAVNRGYSDTVTEFLNDGQHVDTVFAYAEPSAMPNSGHKISALMLAALYGRKTTIQVLLLWGADIYFTGKHRSYLLGPRMFGSRLPVMLTPLGCAAHQGYLDVVRMLLDAGADPRQDMDGRTAIHEASTTLIVRELLGRGADIHQVCNLDGTPLQAAIWYGRYEVVSCLIEYGASATEATCPEPRMGHKTPLEVAIHSLRYRPRRVLDKNLAIVDLLLAKGAVMDAQQSETYQRLKDVYKRDVKIEF